ncbi:MAG: DUF3298 and DUF4163 domain-containing protein [Tannerella sp.]|jgi:hypothetical protein|nr:DUF3298 and DUF4163 domain-containing protein [Tannerella sp.]
MKYLSLLLKGALACSVIALFTCCKPGTGQPVKNNVSFDSLTVDKLYHIDNVETNPRCSLQIKFAYPVASENKELSTKLQQQFIASFFDDAYIYMSPQEAAARYAEDYLRNFEKEGREFMNEMENHDMPQEEVEFHENYLSIGNDVVYNRNGLLSFVVNTSYYAGGAHGGHIMTNHVLDIKTGQRIQEKDIFVDKYRDELARILVDEIVKANELKDAADLETIGFFDVSEIIPNGNFYVDETGIVYTFNEYEVAAYAVGAVIVPVPYEKIRHLLLRESPLSNIAF